MGLDEIKSEAELYLASLQDQILPLQDDYIDDAGKYWQGLTTPRPIPEDGDVGNPDPTVARSGLPSWSAFGATLPFSAPFAIRCDEERWPGAINAFVLCACFVWGEGQWTGSIRYKGGWEDLVWKYQEYPAEL